VTIAAGFCCQDGIVLCADTQETIPGYLKSSTQKLFRYELDHLTASFTGSGDSILIDMEVQEIVEAFALKKVSDWHQAKNEIKSVLAEIFKKRISPYAAFKEEPRPNAQLLIALQFDDSALLFRTTGTFVKYVTGAECVGVGDILFYALRDRLYHETYTLAQTSRLAIHILNRVKQNTDGCGGNTDMLLLRSTGRKLAGIPTDDIADLETKFDGFDDAVKKLLLTFPDSTISQDDFEKLIAQFRLDLLSLRSSLLNFDEFLWYLQETLNVDLGAKKPVKPEKSET